MRRIYCHFSFHLKRLPKKADGKAFCNGGASKDRSTAGEDSPSPLALLSFPFFLPFCSLTLISSSTNTLWCYFFQQFPSAPSLRGFVVLAENSRFAQWLKVWLCCTGSMFLEWDTEGAETNSSGGNEGKNKQRNFIHFVMHILHHSALRNVGLKLI